MSPTKIQVSRGDRYGRLVVVSEAAPVVREYLHRPTQRRRRMDCQCDCGTAITVALNHLRSGGTKSCGCLRSEIGGNIDIALHYRKHGEAGSNVTPRTPEYNTWGSMIDRCENKRSRAYEYYGERGIGVCTRWRESYSAFLEDMGRRPTLKHSIDRIDNDGNYEPNNCRWATKSQQMSNRRLMHDVLKGRKRNALGRLI